jgi:hypothetical protein
MPSFDEHLLEKRCLADEFGVLVRRAESQHRLARGGQIRHVALKYHCVRSRSVGFSSDDAGSARVEVLHEPLDRAALARRVAALEHEDEPSAPALTQFCSVSNSICSSRFWTSYSWRAIRWSYG